MVWTALSPGFQPIIKVYVSGLMEAEILKSECLKTSRAKKEFTYQEERLITLKRAVIYEYLC